MRIGFLNRLLCLAAAMTMFCVCFAQAEGDGTINEESTLGLRLREKEGNVIKTKQGLHFMLPEDWPVEKKDGMINPIPIQEYLYTKFKKLESRLDTVEEQLNEITAALEEADRSTDQASLSSSNETRYDELERRLSSLDLAVNKLQNDSSKQKETHQAEAERVHRVFDKRLKVLEESLGDLIFSLESLHQQVASEGKKDPEGRVILE